MIARERAIAILKRFWSTEDLIFLGQFIIPKNADGEFINPREGEFQNFSINDREILYPKDEILKYKRKVFFLGNVVPGLEDGKYYDIELELEEDENRLQNPYALKIKNAIIREDNHVSPKDFIQQWFYKKGHTPGDAATIAGQLTLNELELYTHTKRFIFELIQNADDMPNGNRDVNIEINLLQNHLLFLHNGKFFDRADVTAISDAAKSTKSKGLTQTGYKGIGFKSVFTDSTRVYIKSGAYFFKFDKLEPIYNDFYQLYKGYSDSLNPIARGEFEIEFRGRETEFTNIDKIPWQIKPIWIEQKNVNSELRNSNFMANNQVAIALEIGESILRQKDYNGMILGLLKEPRFLLFLRKTKGFKYIGFTNENDQIVDIAIKEELNNLGVYSNEKLIASYIKDEFEINIGNDDFAKAGLNFQKREIEGGKIEFFDNENRKLENIPEKLGRLDKTIISLSAKVNRYDIEKLDKEDSILFNYLPTSDQRFGFPFLVNADFVCKTDREFIQIENKWNHYIFYNLGRISIEWIAKLGGTKHEYKEKSHYSYPKTYLNLLPEDLLDEENEELASINIAFNKGLKDALETTSFIIDAKGVLKKCDEIIIDDTSISEILGIPFFNQVSKSRKMLPLIVINKSSLKKKYLNIEHYNSESLYAALQEKNNILFLKTVLQSADDFRYLNFLKWLDTFSKKNETDSDWIISFPFIRIEREVLSIKKVLNVTDFILKTSKTKSIERLLVKIGFKLSEFYIDENDYKHIYSVIHQQESYLKNDVKLFEQIATAKELNKLTAEEKNSLLTFFENLEKVGEAKYAKSLALFKSKKTVGKLKPLATLISNSCQNLPIWLTDFVIDEQEENALNENFKSNLIKEKDLLEKVFCNPITFNELINNIDPSNIEAFYAYILKIHKELPEDAEELNYNQISWFYMPDNDMFALPSTIYCPDSVTKLSNDKFLNVKSVIESLSTDKLPIYSSINLKKIFNLQCRIVNINTLLTGDEAFEVLTSNDFLDWVQAEGEKEFFTQFSITKVEEQYKITPSDGLLQYYTDNQDLVTFIESSTLKTKLVVLPKEVYTEDRKKIGLLEGTDLLKYGLENGMAIPSFAKFIYQANDAELSLHYLSLLESVNIDTSKTYDSELDEFKIIKLAVLNVVTDDEKLKSFREKITIDGISLLERAISEDIFFFDKKIALKTKLSEILPNYKDKTFPLSDIIAKFIDFNDKQNLFAIFKSDNRIPKKVLKELSELEVVNYSPIQTFFLSFYKSHYPAVEVFKDKIPFSVNRTTNQSQYEKDICEFLDICLKEDNYIGFIKHNVIPDFNPTNYILNEEYTIESEKPPLWLLDWVNTSNTENKLAYLKLLGINDDLSPVVLFRKAIKESQPEEINLKRESIDNNFLLINTLTWLSEEQTKNNLVLKKEVLQPLYTKLQNRKIPVIGLPFPSLTILNIDNYTLIQLEENAILHLIHEGWGEYKQEIFLSLIGENKITDDVVPLTYRSAWKIVVKKFVREADITKLQNNSYPFDEDYYLEWELKDKYKIAIYKDSHLPYVIKYNETIIETVADKLVDYINGTYYIIKNNIEYLFSSFSGVLDLSILRMLSAERQKYIENKKKKEFEVEYTDEETEALKRLFGDKIPKNFHKDLNIAALISALIYLAKNGYDVTEAENNLKNSHVYSQLSPVYSADKTEIYTIMGRSAKTGLLYLTANSWERLASDDIKLFVSTGNREQNHHLFNSKQELLNVSDTNFQVFRVAANSTATNTDSILNGTFDKNKVLLIFKMKENRDYNSIFGGGIRENENTPDYENVNTYEDSEY
nr:hypothetical protein [uncultured Flavobacterium sp.]